MKLFEDAREIIQYAITSVQPDAAVRRALESLPEYRGRLILIAAGKAAWQMAQAACGVLGDRIDGGLVITKYAHAKGPLGNLKIVEAGHPVPDENSFVGTQIALDLVRDLGTDDLVLFLLSGGGSALFEKPLVAGTELQDITAQLLASGADIVEMNTVRKRLSSVKGGRFAQICAPARVYSIVLSDILGDPLDMIASGPAYPDHSTCAQAMEIVRSRGLRLSDAAMRLLLQETPKELDNVETCISGSVRQLCAAAAEKCRTLGYETHVLTDALDCEARDAGAFLASIARTHAQDGAPSAWIAGGETIVHLRGNGKGGRNQELALSAAISMDGLNDVLLFSVGSDGTDGPTDAAGGYVTGATCTVLHGMGMNPSTLLDNNDAFHALASCGEELRIDADNDGADSPGGLIVTGPTGTNVNDVAVLLIRHGGRE